MDSTVTRRELLALFAAFAAAGEAQAQDPVKSAPRNYRVAFENDNVRVLEYYARAGAPALCGQGRHYHPVHLVISLSDVKARVTLDDGKVIVAQDKAGECFWAPAGWHTVENLSTGAAHAYLVEAKDPNWKPSTWSEKG
jgi:hypothetical protein